MDQPLSAQPTQYVPPYSPGGWGGQPSAYGYAPSPQATWIEPSYPPPAHPASSQPAPAAARRRRRWPWYVLLVLVVLGLLLSGSWILILRPAIHQSVDGEIRQGLQQAVDQIPPVAEAAPAGVPFPVTEDNVNQYIAQNLSQLAPITDMHVALQPDVMVVTFQAYGFESTVRFGLAVEGGRLTAQNVAVSGLLSWVESSAELAPRLNDALGQVSGKLGRSLSSATIDDGQVVFVFA